MPNLIQQILPRQQDEFYSVLQLQNACQALRICLGPRTLNQFAQGLKKDDLLYLRDIQTRLGLQVQYFRAFGIGVPDSLTILHTSVIELVQALEPLIRTQDEANPQLLFTQLNATNYKLVNNAIEHNNLDFLKLLYFEQRDVVFHIKSKPELKDLTINKYINGIDNWARRHQQEAQRAEEQAHLQRLIIHAPLPVPALHRQPGNAMLRPTPRPATRTKEDTHTATIHKDATESALRLQKDFPASLFNEEMSNLSWVFANTAENKFKDELLRIVCSTLEEGEAIPDATKLERSVRTAFKNTLENTDFIDRPSGISLSDILKILLVGINSIANKEAQQDAYLQLCKALYLLQEEYVNRYSARTTASCEAGFFNGLIYSQATTLPNHVQIRIHSRSHAVVAIGEKMQSFALGLLKTNNYETAEEFSAAVLKLSKAESTKIVQAVVADYYEVFGYDSSEKAAKDTAEIDKHCTTLCGCSSADLFDALPIDFERMFRDAQQARQGSQLKQKLT